MSSCNLPKDVGSPAHAGIDLNIIVKECNH